jgi:hypothetical protein
MRLFECQNCGQLLYFENTLCEKWPEHGRAVPHGVGPPSPRGGHYYWDRLVRDGVWLDAFRALFGDERQDYQACLGQHYAAYAVNGLNHSVGQPDLYPFVLAPTVMGKLRFIHGFVHPGVAEVARAFR